MTNEIIVHVDDSFCSEEVLNDDRFYIKQELYDNKAIWAIYSPEGERMAQAFSKEMALAIIRQNDLSAVQVH